MMTLCRRLIPRSSSLASAFRVPNPSDDDGCKVKHARSKFVLRDAALRFGLLPLHRLVSLLLFERLGGGGHVTEALTWVLPPIEHRGQGVAQIDGEHRNQDPT